MDDAPRPPEATGLFTQLLSQAASGDGESAARILPLVYAELQRMARGAMGRERSDHTLQATALVHEAWMRLSGGQGPTDWASRGEFFSAAAESMRRILVDHARSRARQKRGGNRPRLDLDAADLSDLGQDPTEFLALDEAIQRLEEVDGRAAEVVRLRFFAGLDVEETAAVMSISPRTVHREWAFARAELLRFLSSAD